MTTTKDTLSKQFLSGAAFAVPLSFLGDHRATVETLLGRRLRSRVISVEGYEIEGVAIPGRIHGSLTQPLLFGATGPFAETPLTFFEARVRRRLMPLVTSEAARVEIHADLLIGDEERMKQARRMRSTADLYQPMLEEASRLTGWKIVFHVSAPSSLPPFPDDETTLHLLPGCTPPGQRGEQWMLRIFGLKIDDKGEWVKSQKPTRGRGIVVQDEDGSSVVQLLNRTAYVLFPVISLYHGRESLEIFQRTLRALWNRLRREPGARACDAVAGRNRKAFVTTLTKQALDTPTFWNERIAQYDRDIAEAQERLRLLNQTRREVLNIAEAAKKADLFTQTVTRLPEDHRRITCHPDVACVYTRDGGVHVETRLITQTYRGNRYLLGRYTIRIGSAGEVSVWGIETRHPGGIPHPHLARSGVACFGTASDAIIGAAGELRYADCILCILRWLKEGYTPESAETKIEEWPVESEPLPSKEG